MCKLQLRLSCFPQAILWPHPYPTLALQVIIESRNTAVRNILNAKDLEKECNVFNGWTFPADTPFKRVQCRCGGPGSWRGVATAPGGRQAGTRADRGC